MQITTTRDGQLVIKTSVPTIFIACELEAMPRIIGFPVDSTERIVDSLPEAWQTLVDVAAQLMVAYSGGG